MSATIPILVVDDHPVVRAGLVAMLKTEKDFEVVGEAADGQEANRLHQKLSPSVTLLDLEMPGMDGVTALKEIMGRDPEAGVIVFTAFDTDDRILSALGAGARGYLLKGAPRRELFEAIRVVHEGGSLLQPLVATKLLRRMSEAPGGQSKSEMPRLTRREQEVLECLGRGMTNKEIAVALVISERTVKFHVSALLRKLNAGNRTEAVTLAAQLGLIEI